MRFAANWWEPGKRLVLALLVALLAALVTSLLGRSPLLPSLATFAIALAVTLLLERNSAFRRAMVAARDEISGRDALKRLLRIGEQVATRMQVTGFASTNPIRRFGVEMQLASVVNQWIEGTTRIVRGKFGPSVEEQLGTRQDVQLSRPRPVDLPENLDASWDSLIGLLDRLSETVDGMPDQYRLSIGAVAGWRTPSTQNDSTVAPMEESPGAEGRPDFTRADFEAALRKIKKHPKAPS
jgi:hypothetical protein